MIFKSLIILCGLVFSLPSSANSEINFELKPLLTRNIIPELKKGGNIIFVHHFHSKLDPQNLSIKKCKKQSYLTKEGRSRAKLLRRHLNELKIPITKVFSNSDCQSMETAELIFKKYKSSSSFKKLLMTPLKRGENIFIVGSKQSLNLDHGFEGQISLGPDRNNRR